MSDHKNEFGQPVGFPIKEWEPRPWPPRTVMTGRYCRLEPLNVEAHANQLYESHVAQRKDGDWTYLPYGPFASFEDYRAWLSTVETTNDPLFFTIIDLATEKAVGVASYLRINPALGTIEVGHIHFSPQLQQKPAATESMYLMMANIFDELGYRRYEWKCDALNARSRKAALRFGFSFEGVWRQAAMYKGRSRDTSWFGMPDTDWHYVKPAYEAWLAGSNFNAVGEQKESLTTLIERSKAEHA